MPLSVRVGMVLLSRVTDDLRAVALLASRGMPLQAMTVASSLFETAFVLSWIGANETRAEQWIDHDDPKWFWKVGKTVQAVLEACGLGEAQIQRQELIYSQLCCAKHGNPLLQKVHGVVSTPDGIDVAQTPHRTGDAVCAS